MGKIIYEYVRLGVMPIFLICSGALMIINPEIFQNAGKTKSNAKTRKYGIFIVTAGSIVVLLQILIKIM